MNVKATKKNSCLSFMYIYILCICRCRESEPQYMYITYTCILCIYVSYKYVEYMAYSIRRLMQQCIYDMNSIPSRYMYSWLLYKWPYRICLNFGCICPVCLYVLLCCVFFYSLVFSYIRIFVWMYRVYSGGEWIVHRGRIRLILFPFLPRIRSDLYLYCIYLICKLIIMFNIYI